MTVQRTRQHHALEVAPHPDQVLDRVAVPTALHVLIDDGPGVELLGGVMSRRQWSSREAQRHPLSLVREGDPPRHREAACQLAERSLEAAAIVLELRR
jgi:hypothetical protein